MSAGEWLNPFELYDPSKPAGRLMYFWGNFVYPFILVVLVSFCGALTEGVLGYYNESPILDLLFLPITVLLLLASVLIIIRRLRDLGNSGWLVLLLLVPVVNFVFGLWLLLAKGVQKRRAATDTVPAGSETISPPRVPDNNTQVRYCIHCGAEVRPGASFCGDCGSKAI